MVAMPLDVLARTCESFPQPVHEAGDERLDQRTARLDTAAALHQGHLCMRLNVGVDWQAAALRHEAYPDQHALRRNNAAAYPYRTIY
jgi:hypothetical protein